MTNVLDTARKGYGRVVDGATYGYVRSVDALRNVRLPRKGDERGDIVQTIIIIAIFVVIVVVVGNLIFQAVETAAKDTSNCITSANKVKTGNTNNC